MSGIRRFTYLVRDTPGACALTIGEPDFHTPDEIKHAAKAAISVKMIVTSFSLIFISILSFQDNRTTRQ